MLRLTDCKMNLVKSVMAPSIMSGVKNVLRISILLLNFPNRSRLAFLYILRDGSVKLSVQVI